MKQIKTRHKLIPAIIMLLVAAITMSTASYAWFTMNKKVEVSGINLNVVAPANILIREVLAEPGVFANAVTITKSVGGKLKPASTANGTGFYHLTDQGSAKVNYTTGVISGWASGDIEAASGNADSADGFFVDFPLELINTGGSPIDIGLNNVSVTSTDSSAIIGAVRFAILHITENQNIDTANNPIFCGGDSDKTHNVLKSDTVGSHLLEKTAKHEEMTAKLFTLAAGGDPADGAHSTKVRVRVWVEGMDTACSTPNSGKSFQVTFDFAKID